MNFGPAVQSSLSQYVGFSGRARRSEYWWFALFEIVIVIILDVIDAVIKTPILGILALAFVLPGLAVGFRRLHDTNRSAWWILISLIPLVGSIILIVFLCQDSTPGDNRYGPSPKYPQAGWGSPPQWAGGA